MKCFTLVAWLVVFPFCASAQAPRTIHVFVALADNVHQGIVPVPARIGNGDDLENNLYWGCDEGLKTFFKKSNGWKLVYSNDPGTSVVLERCIFKHASSNTYLVADAYRGREIKAAIENFIIAVSDAREERISIQLNGRPVNLLLSGGADLVAYIGHNGLMDFSIAPSPVPVPKQKPAIVLCCKSRQYFGGILQAQGAKPILLTTQLMYPGSFILRSALEGWIAGESSPNIKMRAARAYAKNQNISEKAALGVFAD